jgi:hypothetical protein
MDAQTIALPERSSPRLFWKGGCVDWEILEFRAESFQRLFAPPRREESDSAIQTASGSGPSGKPESQEKEAGEGGRMGLNNPERWEC